MAGWLKKLLGDRGERMAAKFLRKQGFKILARQYKTRMGELDLIARDRDVVVFVEVKTRRSNAAGHPVEAITPAKQAKLTQLALAFLKQHDLLNHPARFDVVTVYWKDGEKTPTVEHFQDAFPAVGEGQMFS